VMHRYDATGTLRDLREKLDEERAALARLQRVLEDFVPPDTRRWRSHYERAHFWDTNKDDIRRAVSRCEEKAAYLERRVAEEERRHGEDEDEVELVY